MPDKQNCPIRIDSAKLESELAFELSKLDQALAWEPLPMPERVARAQELAAQVSSEAPLAGHDDWEEIIRRILDEQPQCIAEMVAELDTQPS